VIASPASAAAAGRGSSISNAKANDWLVVRQLTIVGPSGKHIRPDLVVFLNGLPVGVIELKDPTDESATLGAAVRQFERYKRTVPDFFVPNVALAVSDGLLTRIGSLTAGASRFMPWRPEHGGTPTLQALVEGLFAPERFLDYLQHCVVFEENERGDITKKIAGYHQFRAVRKARGECAGGAAADRTWLLRALTPALSQGEREMHFLGGGGVVWHTQGSGKSLTMLMLAGALIREPAMENPTIVMVTDRNDLDDQLFETFAGGRDLLRQKPVQAESKQHLKSCSIGRVAGSSLRRSISLRREPSPQTPLPGERGGRTV
jgi:type I restriction enzyme, R subunit